MSFIDAVANYDFMRNAIAVAILASIAAGIVGAYVVSRRITYIAGGISHSVLGGIGLFHYLAVVGGIGFLAPVYGALFAALASALIIGYVSIKAKEREDTVIGALWAVGMATGILFISATPGYNQDLVSYLFGNILMVSSLDMWLVVILDLVVIGVGVIFYRQLQAVCFDEEFARARGLRVEFYYILLLVLTSLTVVVLISVVGVIMVIALLSLPAAIASRFTRTLASTMFLAILVSAVLSVAGLALSFSPDLPAGATIVLLTGVVYIIVTAFFRRRST
jgi:zinc transport system permease protein